MLDLFLFGQGFEPGLCGIGIVRQQDDEPGHFLIAVGADLLINLLDQTGQVFGDLACEDVDHRAAAVASSIAQSFAGIWSGDVPDVKGGGPLADLQPRLDFLRSDGHPGGGHQQNCGRDQQTSHGMVPFVKENY